MRRSVAIPDEIARQIQHLPPGEQRLIISALLRLGALWVRKSPELQVALNIAIDSRNACDLPTLGEEGSDIGKHTEDAWGPDMCLPEVSGDEDDPGQLFGFGLGPTDLEPELPATRKRRSRRGNAS